MTTTKQKVANRRNAKKSTGLRIAEGGSRGENRYEFLKGHYGTH